jgi:hypothetical protein
VGPHCSFCGTFTGPFSEVEGLFTVLICIPCLEVRLAGPDTLLGWHDPGRPWGQWGCPIEGCGEWFIGPWYLEWHAAAEHPGWTATYELLRPYPNQRQRVVYRRSAQPAQGRVLVRGRPRPWDRSATAAMARRGGPRGAGSCR